MNLSDILDNLAAAIAELDTYVTDPPPDDDLTVMVPGLQRLTGPDGLRTALSAVVSGLENLISTELPADEWDVELDGVPVKVSRKWSAGSTKWDTSACWTAVVEAANESGYDPLLVLSDVAAVSYFRVKPLKGLGINPDLYRTTDGGRFRIVVG